jgi:DNA mismatch endonuclease (patch repair protein)
MLRPLKFGFQHHRTKRIPRTCGFCGRLFYVNKVSESHPNKYCSNVCRPAPINRRNSWLVNASQDDPRKLRLHASRRGIPAWSKGTKGIVKSWAKGHTKFDNLSIMKMSQARARQAPPMLGRTQTEHWHKVMNTLGEKSTSIEIRLQEELNKEAIQFLANPVIEHFFRPDIVLSDQKIAIFADGCYFHGCLSCFKNQSQHQILRHKSDEAVSRRLTFKGWRVYRFWEHQINQDAKSCIEGILLTLRPEEAQMYEVGEEVI